MLFFNTLVLLRFLSNIFRLISFRFMRIFDMMTAVFSKLARCLTSFCSLVLLAADD